MSLPRFLRKISSILLLVSPLLILFGVALVPTPQGWPPVLYYGRCPENFTLSFGTQGCHEVGGLFSTAYTGEPGNPFNPRCRDILVESPCQESLPDEGCYLLIPENLCFPNITYVSELNCTVFVPSLMWIIALVLSIIGALSYCIIWCWRTRDESFQEEFNILNPSDSRFIALKI